MGFSTFVFGSKANPNPAEVVVPRTITTKKRRRSRNTSGGNNGNIKRNSHSTEIRKKKDMLEVSITSESTTSSEEKARRRNREKRSIRQRLKNLAATKIQALAKGFLVRRTGVRQYFKQLSFIESKKEDERMRNNKTKLKLLSKMRKAIKKSMKRANKYITYSEQDQNLLNI